LISALLGSAGVVFSLLFSLWSKKKARAALSGLDEREPEDLLHANESNFRLCIAEIRDAALEPSGRLALSGTRAGRLKLLTYDGRKFNLEFPDADEMRTALDLLSPRLNLTLRVNVEWNKNEQRFQRKVTTAKGA